MAENFPPPPPEPPEQPKPPHVAANQPISTVVGNDEVQCRAMDNFRALVLKFAKPLLPAQQSLIEQRLRDFFPNQLHVPDHPPYAAMIRKALVDLNDEEGSSEKAISEFIKNEYHDLPWAHDTMLEHHLRKLTDTGDIFLTSDGCYILRSAITHPNHLYSLNPYYDSCPRSTPCCISSSTPSSTSSSSPCSSYFSSPSSSTNSSRSPSPCRGSRRKPLKRKIKRKPNLIQGRGSARGRPRKNVQGRVRGRPRKGSQGVGEGTSHQKILKRKVGRPRKIKLAEEECEEENAGQMVLARQDAVPRTSSQGQGNEILREQGEHQNQKIVAGRKKNQLEEQKSHAVEERNHVEAKESMVISGDEICKEQNAVIDEQGWQQQNARGRPCKNIQGRIRGRPRKKNQGVGEGTSHQKVRERSLDIPGKIKLAEEEREEENAGQMVLAQNQAEEHHDAVTRSGAHGQEDKFLREQGERQNQEIVAGEKKNQVQESHETEERNHVNEKESIVIVDGPCNEHNAVIDEQAQQEPNISIKGQQHVIDISDSEYGGPFDTCNEQSKPEEGKSVEQNQSEKEENCFAAEQNQPQEQQMEENKEESPACSWRRVVWLPVRRRRRQFNETDLHQEEQEKDEMLQEGVQLEDLVTMNNDAEGYACTHEDGAQQDQLQEEQNNEVDHHQQVMDISEEALTPCQQQGLPMDQNQPRELELVVVEKLCWKEGIQNEMIPGSLSPEDGSMIDQNLMMISEARDTSVVENRNGREKQVKGSNVEQIEPEQDNVRRGQVQPMPEQMPGTEINIQHHGNEQSGGVEQDQVGEDEMIDKIHQMEGETSEMVQKRIELKDEVKEKQHDPMIIQNKAQPKGASMEWNKSEEQQNDATGGQVQAEKQYFEWTGEKFQPFRQKEMGSVEHNQLEKQEIQQADKLCKQGEQQNQVIHKDIQEVSEENHGAMFQMEALVEGTSLERNEAKNQEDDATGKQAQSQARCMKGTKEKFLQCRQEETGNVELDQIEGEAELSDEQHKQEEEFKVIRTEDQHHCHGVITIQGIQEEASEEQHGSGEGVDGSTSQLIQPQEECKEWTGEKIQLFGQQPRGTVDQDLLEKLDVEIGDRWRPSEEQEKELIQKELELVEEVSKEQHDAMMTQYEAQEVEGSMEHNEFKKEQSDVTGGKVQLKAQCVEDTKNQIQLCGPEQGGRVEQCQLEKQEVGANERSEPEKEQRKVMQKEIELTVEGTEEQHDVLMIPSETHVKDESVVQNESEEQLVDVIREGVQSEEQCFEGTNTKFLPYGHQERRGVELCQLDKGVEMADKIHKPEEQQNEITWKESELRCDKHLVLTHTEAHDDQSMEEAKARVEKNHSEECENAVTEMQNYPRLLCSGGIEKNIQPSVEEKYPKRQVKLNALYPYDQKMKIFDREMQETQDELLHSHSQLIKSEPTKTTPIILSLPSNYQQPGLRSLLEGPRSRNKMPAKAENQHEQIKPSQRVLRRHKTNPEFSPATEQSLDKDVDHTSEQVKHRRHGKPRQRNLESAAADDKDIDHTNEPVKDRRRGNPPKRKFESTAVEGASRPRRITRARS